MTPRSRHVAASFALACACALLAAGCGRGDPEVVARAGGDAGAAAARSGLPQAGAGAGAQAGALVDVAGHVRRPGVYRVAPGARVHEAIAAAGGARPGAQLAGLNRAAPVVDGQQVVVPGPQAAGSASPPGGGGAGEATPGAPVSLNSADAAALDELPGIGPVTAERIVADREANGPFAGVDDLDRVAGIGPATIEQLRSAVTA